MKHACTLILLLNYLGLSSHLDLQWVKKIQFGKSVTLNYHPTGFIVDKDENVYLSGRGYYDYYSISYAFYKFSSGGNLMYADSAADHHINGMILYNDEIVTAGTKLVKRNLNGEIVFTGDLQHNPSGTGYVSQLVSTAGYLYTLGPHQYFNRGNFSGSLDWSLALMNYWAFDFDNTLMVARNGFVYVYYVFEPGGAHCITKLDKNGYILWRYFDKIDGMIPDNEGNLFFVHKNQVTRLNPEGKVKWTKSLEHFSLNNCKIFDNTLYVCGSFVPDFSGTDFTTDDKKSGFAMLSPETGELYSEHFFKVFPEMDVEEQFTDLIMKNGSLYLTGIYRDKKIQTFLAKLGPVNITSANSFLNDTGATKISLYANPEDKIIHVFCNDPKNIDAIRVIVRSVNGEPVLIKTDPIETSNHYIDIKLPENSNGVYLFEVHGLLFERLMFTEIKKIIVN